MKTLKLKPGMPLFFVRQDVSCLPEVYLVSAIVAAEDEDDAVRRLTEFARRLKWPYGYARMLVDVICHPDLLDVTKLAEVTDAGIKAENGVVCFRIGQDRDDD